MGLQLRTGLCDTFGIEVPVFGFTHHREVVAAVSRAGAMGVYGAAYFSPEQVEEDLVWIRANTDDRPFAVDVMIPSRGETSEETDLEAQQTELAARIPDEHRRFVDTLLERFAVPPVPEGEPRTPVYPMGPSATAARLHTESAVANGASLIVGALGVPPLDAVEMAHERGVLVGGMVGTARQALRHVEAGVDLVIAQGSEAAAHAGDVSTMVLVPEVVDAVAPLPVVAAGGIAIGRQFLAARALGAQGVWTGSMWRVASESRDPAGVVELLLAAGTTDTVRSPCMTGKPLRQLRSPWNEAWAQPDSPGALPMPMQRILQTDAEQRFDYHGRHDLVVSPIGQVVGQLREARPAAELLDVLVQGYLAALR